MEFVNRHSPQLPAKPKVDHRNSRQGELSPPPNVPRATIYTGHANAGAQSILNNGLRADLKTRGGLYDQSLGIDPNQSRNKVDSDRYHYGTEDRLVADGVANRVGGNDSQVLAMDLTPKQMERFGFHSDPEFPPGLAYRFDDIPKEYIRPASPVSRYEPDLRAPIDNSNDSRRPSFDDSDSSDDESFQYL